jgi:cell division septation protein DedD
MTPQKADQDPKLAFYEKLASKKDQVKNNWNLEAEIDIPEEQEVPSPSEELKKTPLDKQKHVDLPDKEETARSISTLMYTVQIASIEDIDRTEKLIKDLIDQGYEAYYYETNLNGKTYYRIRCGRFASREEALKYAQKIEKEAGLKGFVSRIE